MGRKKKVKQIEEIEVIEKDQVLEEDPYEEEMVEIPAWKLRLLKRKLIHLECVCDTLREGLNNIEHNFFHEDEDC